MSMSKKDSPLSALSLDHGEEAATENFATLERRSARRSERKPSSLPPSFKEVAHQVLLMNNVTKRLSTGHKPPPRKGHHQRKIQSNAHDLLQALRRDSYLPPQQTQVEPEQLSCTTSTADNHSHSESAPDSENEEQLPLTAPDYDYGTVDRKPRTTPMNKLKRSFVRSFRRRLIRRCRPRLIATTILDAAWRSATLYAVPLFVLDYVLFYYMGNPMLDFLPGQATLAWWFNFAGRLLVTLDLARLTQWLFLDCIFLKAHNPYIMFLAFHAQGWPFIVKAWGVWNLVLLHGSAPLNEHWFAFTGWAIFTRHNSGAYILRSELFLRILVALLILGMATVVKRIVLSVRFGRRALTNFKPHLERILQDVCLVAEVAIIAEEAECVQETAQLRRTPREMSTHPSMQWSNVHFNQIEGNDNSSVSSQSSEGVDSQEQQDVFSAWEEPPVPMRPVRSDSENLRLCDVLERWEIPDDKLQSTEASIEEVLKFRRVLHFLDDTAPFGEAFGPAADRNQCIDSAQAVYYSLMKLTPSASAVPFSTITLGTVDESGFVDEAKVKAFQKVLHPDAQNELNMVAFVQSIDSVYKRLRMFQAAVDNSMVIDKVLENIINGVFYFILVLLLMCFLQFNPWPLLVSVSSLLVSVSFALGSSVSKYVEGALLVVARRPYDLGDRIFLTEARTTDTPGAALSWFVEDINLFSTTLRFAGTNEVCTVNNYNVSSAHIVNCNRSPNAIVRIDVDAKLSVLKDNKMSTFRSSLESFVRQHPRRWDTLSFFAETAVNANTEHVIISCLFRSRSSWQDSLGILTNKGKLLTFIYNTMNELGIVYDSPPARNVFYYGGGLEKGHVTEYKNDLLAASNVRALGYAPMPPSIHAADPFLRNLVAQQGL